MRAPILLIAAFLALPAWGDDVAPSHQRTAAPPDARYEIVQSPLVSRLIFKLDKYTGTIFLLTRASNGLFSWQAMARADHPLDKTTSGKVNYQMFSSGVSSTHTYLININTGATWVIVEDQNQRMSWLPIQ